jgi:hypothetical protein
VTVLGVLDSVASLVGTLSKIFQGLYRYTHNVLDTDKNSQQLLNLVYYTLLNIARRLKEAWAKESTLRREEPVARKIVI